MDDYLRQQLLRCDWFEGRVVDIHPVREALVPRSRTLSKPIEAFLAEFGGITLCHEPPLPTEVLRVDATEAIESTNWHDLLKVEDALGRQLTPIGTAGPDTALCDDDGGLYLLDMFGELRRVDADLMRGILGLYVGTDLERVRSERCDAPANESRADSSPLPDYVEKFSERLLEQLRQLGWPDECGPGPPEMSLKRSGLDWTPRIQSFVASFSGLSLEAHSPYHATKSAWWLHVDTYLFNPRSAAAMRDYLGARFCPVGDLSFNSRLLIMDEFGWFFSECQHTGETEILASSEGEFLEGLLGDGFWDHFPFDGDRTAYQEWIE